MLDFLGVTEHFSCMENTPFSFPALFRDTTGEDVSLDGVIFSGSIMSANQEVVEISIEKGEASNEVILSFPALPEGRWSYNVLVQADDGAQRILFSGYISVLGISRVVQSAGDPPMKNRTLLVAMPGEATTRLRMEWMATTAAQAFAAHALQSSKAARTDADTASQAATTATGAASTATERASEAEGYAGAAYASKVAAGNSATAANMSAADAARDAKTAKDAKTAVEGIVSDFPQTVSNGEQAISAAEGEAITAIQAKQADSVLAVGRASQTAQQNIASAQNTAVQAVQDTQQAAEESLSGTVKETTEAKADAEEAAERAKTSATNAGQSAQTASDAATAAQQALAAIPQVDEAGNMTLAGGLTTTGTHNANGGINIPLAVGAPADTMALNRAYALGMVHTVMMHQARTYWLTSSCTATNGVTINHVVPGLYCDARVGGNGRTSLTMRTTGVIGGSNYNKILGYSLPIRNTGSGPGNWSKVSMLMGAGGEWTEYPDAGMDDYRFRPVPGNAPAIARLIEVALYYDEGYKARVRELIGIGNPRSYVVRTTTSAINHDSNTGLESAAYRLVIAQSNQSYNDELAAGVWLMIGGAVNDTVLKLADIRGWDTYHTSSAPALYVDVQAGVYGGMVQMDSPTILNGIGNNTYVRYGLEPYQRSWITTETEEPYAAPEQPTA